MTTTRHTGRPVSRRAAVALVIDPSRRRAYRLFHASNFYLLIILLAVLLGSLIKVS